MMKISSEQLELSLDLHKKGSLIVETGSSELKCMKKVISELHFLIQSYLCQVEVPFRILPAMNVMATEMFHLGCSPKVNDYQSDIR